MVRDRLLAVVSSSKGIMLSPEHDVSIRVFIGLTKHPLEAPRRSISVQKNSASLYATVVEMSSIFCRI